VRDQQEKYEGDQWWSWAVWIDGAPEQLRDIEFVEYTLHPSFPDPVRVVTIRDNNFKLSSLTHDLSLHYPSGEANTA
jgi:transcription initiation factor IIF auxiliary subunit